MAFEAFFAAGALRGAGVLAIFFFTSGFAPAFLALGAFGADFLAALAAVDGFDSVFACFPGFATEFDADRFALSREEPCSRESLRRDPGRRRAPFSKPSPRARWDRHGAACSLPRSP